MDQYLSRDGDLLLGDLTDLPLLAMPLTPRPFVEEMSSVGSPVGEPVATPLHAIPDLSREGPFDVRSSGRFGVGATPRVLDSLPGCQYRMTSYDKGVVGYPPCTQGLPGPLTSSSCNAYMTCSDCFPTFRSREDRLLVQCFPSGGGEGQGCKDPITIGFAVWLTLPI